MQDFSIRQFTSDDWQDYRDIRLEALAKHPSYFCPSQDEKKFTEATWIERINNPNSAIFGLYEHDEDIIGITGVIRENNEAGSDRALMIMSYIKGRYRKKGLSKLFYVARSQWAKKQTNIKTLIVEHRDDNLPSSRAHQKFGYKFIKSYDQTWPDGLVKLCMVYELDI
ncbi:MAG: GNAT family N-acetyltransferase [Pseudobdellovibrio sp.]